MRAGEVIRVDFGAPAGSEPGFVRPAVLVSADVVLAHGPRTVHVVPITSNTARRYPTDVIVEASGLTRGSVAQSHLCTVISTTRVVERELGDVGAVALAQIRSVLADLLDIA
jgi:mRNA interferase MazF